MASTNKVTAREDLIPEKESPEIPLLDLSDKAVTALIRSAKKRGYVTHDQVHALLSSEEVNSEQIENILAKFSEMGVNVVEAMETKPENEPAIQEELEEKAESENALVEVRQRPVPVKSGAKEPCERADDPVRIYLLKRRAPRRQTRPPHSRPQRHAGSTVRAGP